MSDPTFLQTPKAAERLGFATSTLERMRTRGSGPSYLRLSTRRIVYAVDTLDAWARARECVSTNDYAKSK